MTGDRKMVNKNQQEWYKKFYEGTFLIRGWKFRIEEILKGLLSEDQKEMGALLENLGEKIGVEWARENDVRRIDTSQLQLWGKALQKARQKSPEALVQRIRKMNQEVDQKLAC